MGAPLHGMKISFDATYHDAPVNLRGLAVPGAGVVLHRGRELSVYAALRVDKADLAAVVGGGEGGPGNELPLHRHSFVAFQLFDVALAAEPHNILVVRNLIELFCNL